MHNIESLLSFIFGLIKILYYVFWPLIKIIEFLWPVLIYLRYLNPWLWKCAILHGVKWRTIAFMYPYGIGGGYDKDGWWCQRCSVLYCQKDTKK